MLGRDGHCDLTFDDPGVSRRHARVTNADGRMWVEDVGSSNGTWVHGERITGRRELFPGQTVQLGAIVLRLEDVPDRDVQSVTRRPRRSVSIIRVALVGAFANSVLLAAGVVIQFLTDWTGGGTWLAAPLVGMVASLVEVGKEALTRPRSGVPGAATGPMPEGAPGGGSEPRAWEGQDTPARRRAPVGAGVIVAVLVIGGGGLVLTYGVARLSSFITGNQTGTERLVEPVSKAAQGVTVSVQSVEQTRDFTRVTISMRNNLPNTITLPLYKNVTLRDPEGTTLGADAFRSSWSDTIAPGQVTKGTVVFPGHLPDIGIRATLAFATVFEQGFDGPDSIVVDGLVLQPFE